MGHEHVVEAMGHEHVVEAVRHVVVFCIGPIYTIDNCYYIHFMMELLYDGIFSFCRLHRSCVYKHI